MWAPGCDVRYRWERGLGLGTERADVPHRRCGRASCTAVSGARRIAASPGRGRSAEPRLGAGEPRNRRLERSALRALSKAALRPGGRLTPHGAAQVSDIAE